MRSTALPGISARCDAVELILVSVNRGIACPIRRRNGNPVISAIAKSGIAEPIVFVGGHGVAGNVQVDRSVHGGIDKAVLAYSADHWPWWQAEKGFVCSAGCFGENLTVAGADEGDVSIRETFFARHDARVPLHAPARAGCARTC